MKIQNYVFEDNEHFFVTYNAKWGLINLLFGIVFTVLMLWLAQTVFKESIRVPLTIFSGFLLVIFVVSIPYSVSNISKKNRGILWAGSKKGLYLGGDVSERFFYEWEHISKVTFIDKLEYTLHVDEHYRESNVLLFEVESVKNPITGNFSKFMLDFDKKKNKRSVIKFGYPEGTKETVVEFLEKYSSGEMKLDHKEYVKYEFGA